MSQKGIKPNQVLVVLLIALFVVLTVCCCAWQATRLLPSTDEPAGTAEVVETAALTIAYSPEKEEMFTALVSSFNVEVAAPSGELLDIVAVRYEPDLMIEAAIDGRVQAISPDSSIWLDVLDREWAARTGREAPLVGQTERYAISPIVIAMWEDVARSMGYPEKALGWADLLERARSDPEFRWSHPSTTSAAVSYQTVS